MLQIQFTLKLEKEEERLPIVERIALVIEALDAEPLICRLEKARAKSGRRDYPNRVMWHCLVAFGCLGVRTVPEGIRLLEISSQLRKLCGIESTGGIPTKHAFYRFEKRLSKQNKLLEQMLDKLVQRLCELLPGFGRRLCADSTKIHSLCNGHKPAADSDASWKKYEHSYIDKEGNPKKSMVKWFGYKLHLMVDAKYELPVASVLSTARDNDAPHFESLYQKAKQNLPQPDAPEKSFIKSVALDKGYDETSVYKLLWNDGVQAIVPLCEKTHEENKVLLPEEQLVCQRGDRLRFDGLETARQALRYDVPRSCPRISAEGYCEFAGEPKASKQKYPSLRTARRRRREQFADGCKQKLVRVKLRDETLQHLGPVPRDSKDLPVRL